LCFITLKTIGNHSIFCFFKNYFSLLPPSRLQENIEEFTGEIRKILQEKTRRFGRKKVRKFGRKN